MRGAIILAVLLVAAPALAADKPPVPAEMQAAWAQQGKCNKTSERFEIGAFRAGFEDGHQGAVHYDAARNAIVWDDDTKRDFFMVGPRGVQLIHVRADGARERFVKCPGKLMRRR
jgi:hypothetical protein